MGRGEGGGREGRGGGGGGEGEEGRRGGGGTNDKGHLTMERKGTRPEVEERVGVAPPSPARVMTVWGNAVSSTIMELTPIWMCEIFKRLALKGWFSLK